MNNISSISKQIKYVAYCIGIFFFSACAFEHSIVVMIPSYNNAQWYKRNLDAVFAQNYTNYKILYIDDCSADGTADLVERYIAEKKQSHRSVVIRNKDRQLALANIYYAVHRCDDHDIVVVLDGDDWWNTHQALAIINQAYQDPAIWMTYGRHVKWPQGGLGWGSQLSHQRVKKHSFRNGQYLDQQRTFYAWLFKQVKLEDLLCVETAQYAGQFYPTNYDIAMMCPIIEMAAHNFKFLPNAMYVYNVGTQVNDWTIHRKDVVTLGKFIREKKPYAPLAAPVYRAHYQKDSSVDLLMLGQEPRSFPSVVQQDIQTVMPIDLSKKDFTQIINQKSAASYLLLQTSLEGVSQDTVLTSYIDALEQTHAQAVFFGNLEKTIPQVRISNDIVAWQWKWAQAKLGNPFIGKSCLVRKKDLQAVLHNRVITSLSDLYDALLALFDLPQRVGLSVVG
ncbi:MAG: glycosyltransferase family A protein [Candidatus Babeliales bacterium]